MMVVKVACFFEGAGTSPQYKGLICFLLFSLSFRKVEREALDWAEPVLGLVDWAEPVLEVLLLD